MKNDENSHNLRRKRDMTDLPMLVVNRLSLKQMELLFINDTSYIHQLNKSAISLKPEAGAINIKKDTTQLAYKR